jgi:hypothetical protein
MGGKSLVDGFRVVEIDVIVARYVAYEMVD